MTVGPDLGALPAVFEDARRRGFLGPRPVAEQIAHAVAFARLIETLDEPVPFLDLGSGAGMPGLVLAALWPELGATLLDSSQRRSALLRRTVASLGWAPRVVVVEGRAEALARDTGLRGSFGLVVARSFAGPGVTAEIGGAFVTVGGRLVVSEPQPDPGASARPAETADSGRWPRAGLAGLGLSTAELQSRDGAGIAVMYRLAPVTERWPRGVGIPAKRPLW